jgi:hypothetical protein
MADNSQSSSAFNLGRGAHIGTLSVGGHVAGHDVVVGTSPTDAMAASDQREILELLVKVQAQLAALEGAPAGLREDATDELRKAQAAGEQGDDHRLAEKLQSAQSYLERIATAVPAAVSIAQTVAALAVRLTGQA